MVIYYRITGEEGGVKGLVPIVVPTPQIAKPGPVTSLQARGGGVDQQDWIVFRVDIGHKKVHIGQEKIKKSIEDTYRSSVSRRFRI